MTDHSPSLLPGFQAEPADTGHTVLPTLSVPTVTLSKRVHSGAAIERQNRSALWFAATGRWMNRSFDPAGSEAIRESYGMIPATAGEDDEG
jgi:hypothetical protein